MGTSSVSSGAKRNNPGLFAVDTTWNIYTADYNNDSIRKVSTGGVITTICGQGPSGWGYSGDQTTASAAQLDHRWVSLPMHPKPFYERQW